MISLCILASCSIFFYLQSVYGFEMFNVRTTTVSSIKNNYRYLGHGNGGILAIRNSRPERSFNGKIDPGTHSTLYLKNQVVSTENMFSDLLPNPNPTFQAIDVVTACMDTLVQNRHDTKIGLDVCFAFSNDRCRAAIGGNINDFYQYATNPTFTYLTSCVSYRIVSMGPIINGTVHRGAMQTVLMEVIPSITTSMTTIIETLPRRPRPLSNIKYTTSTTQHTINRSSSDTHNDDMSLDRNTPVPRRFLWTLQQQRRPPLQNCWMIHEVLYTKNAFHQTM